MPNKDGTGPQGKGPKTGRQMGNCEKAELSVGTGRGPGRCGNQRGCGRGFRQNQSE